MKSLTDIITEDLGKIFNKNCKADLSKTYIICDTARSKWGKTGTLNSLIDILSAVSSKNLTYSFVKSYSEIRRTKDRYAFFIINDVKIFVGTAGDYNKIVKGNLDKAFQWMTGDEKEGSSMPNVVVIAAHSSGTPIETIRKYAIQYNCNTIWFRNFHDEKTSTTIRKAMSSASAESIIAIIEKLFA